MGATTVLDTTNQLYVNVDQSKIFLGENEFINAVFNHTDGATAITLNAGQLMGRITTGSLSGSIVPLDKDATDGSQFPLGILTETITIQVGEAPALSICVAGYVAEDKVLFASGESLNSVVSGRELRDRIAGDTLGIRLLSGTNLTKADNF